VDGWVPALSFASRFAAPLSKVRSVQAQASAPATDQRRFWADRAVSTVCQTLSACPDQQTCLTRSVRAKCPKLYTETMSGPTARAQP
jgi:hypothetical protein